MLRIVVAVLAFFAFSQAASAEAPRSLQAYNAKVRSAVSDVAHEVGGVGGAHIRFQVAASGKVTPTAVNATDRGLKWSLRQRLLTLQVPPPPAWTDPPLRFAVTVVFNP